MVVFGGETAAENVTLWQVGGDNIEQRLGKAGQRVLVPAGRVGRREIVTAGEEAATGVRGDGGGGGGRGDALTAGR
ncbi:hypothetical protein VYU27_005264 [Nannochloropsis oceanica]